MEFFSLGTLVLIGIGFLYNNHCRQIQIQIVDARIEQLKVDLKECTQEEKTFLRQQLAFEREVKKAITGWYHLHEVEQQVDKRMSR